MRSAMLSLTGAVRAAKSAHQSGNSGSCHLPMPLQQRMLYFSRRGMLAAVNHGHDALPRKGSRSACWCVRCRHPGLHVLLQLSGCMS